jgi:hypothetical protein
MTTGRYCHTWHRAARIDLAVEEVVLEELIARCQRKRELTQIIKTAIALSAGIYDTHFSVRQQNYVVKYEVAVGSLAPPDL